MKQLRTVGQSHQGGACLAASVRLRPTVPNALGRAMSTGTAMPTTTAPVAWRSFATVSLSERAFGKRLHGYDIPATGTCRPKEPPT